MLPEWLFGPLGSLISSQSERFSPWLTGYTEKGREEFPFAQGGGSFRCYYSMIKKTLGYTDVEMITGLLSWVEWIALMSQLGSDRQQGTQRVLDKSLPLPKLPNRIITGEWFPKPVSPGSSTEGLSGMEIRRPHPCPDESESEGRSLGTRILTSPLSEWDAC